MAKKFQKSKRQEREPKEFDEEVLQIDRVTRVVKGGRRLRFRCLVAIGGSSMRRNRHFTCGSRTHYVKPDIIPGRHECARPSR